MARGWFCWWIMRIQNSPQFLQKAWIFRGTNSLTYPTPRKIEDFLCFLGGDILYWRRKPSNSRPTWTTTWRIIPVSKLGSPPFISHVNRPFGRGPTLPDLLGTKTITMVISHVSESWDDPPSNPFGEAFNQQHQGQTHRALSRSGHGIGMLLNFGGFTKATWTKLFG